MQYLTELETILWLLVVTNLAHAANYIGEWTQKNELRGFLIIWVSLGVIVTFALLILTDTV